MTTQIETLQAMQTLESEAGFPNEGLWNELEDRIIVIEKEADKVRRFGKSTSSKNLEFGDKSSKIHY